jgi:hypothetical protein
MVRNKKSERVLISKSAFARLQGVTPQRVNIWLKEGLPTVNGKIDSDVGEKWRHDNANEKQREAYKRRGAVRPELQGESSSDLRRRYEAIKVELGELALAKERCELIDRGKVHRWAEGMGRIHRDAHLAFVARASNAIASELGVNAGQLLAALDREMRQHLTELAELPVDLEDEDNA